jgi:hypothetical protein
MPGVRLLLNGLGEYQDMYKLSTRLIIGLLTFLLGMAATTVWYLKRPSTNQQVRLIIPKASWEPIYFKGINSATNLSGQTDLRMTSLPEGDIEARMWWGFGLSPLEGITIRRAAGHWSAIHVKADHYYEPGKVDRKELRPPESGWDACWERLVDAEILKLPDASEVNCGADGLDGIAFVIETNANSTYRTYKYGNPTLAKCNEAKQLLRITKIIDEEFSWDD